MRVRLMLYGASVNIRLTRKIAAYAQALISFWLHTISNESSNFVIIKDRFGAQGTLFYWIFGDQRTDTI